MLGKWSSSGQVGSGVGKGTMGPCAGSEWVKMCGSRVEMEELGDSQPQLEEEHVLLTEALKVQAEPPDPN